MRRPCLLLSRAGVAALAMLVTPAWAGALPAAADSTDGTITVVVAFDSDGNGDYDAGADRPQPGIGVTVTDAGGSSLTRTTDEAGTVVVEPSAELTGGRYFVTAEIPSGLDLSPVPASETFAPFGSTVDVTSEDQTVHLGVVRAEPDPPPAAPEPESPPAPAPAPKPQLVPAPPAPPRFAVGNQVWADLNRDGRQDQDEPPASRTSVQLLAADGTVLGSTTTDRAGRYRFDNLDAGSYSLRFAGIRPGFRFSPPRASAPAGDSDPDYTGNTPPFTLAVDRPGVRPAGAGDGVQADYVDDTVDAGIAKLTYAIGSVVWQDLDRNGLLDPDEPGSRAHVSLLDARGDEVGATETDDQGRFLLAKLDAGTYRLRFSELGTHRQLTTARIGSDPTVSSAADPRTRTTRSFTLNEATPGLVPASDVGDVDADFVLATLNAGTVGSYSIANRVWRDLNGDGVAGAGEPGVGGVRVELLDARSAVVATTVTGRSGRYVFDRLTAGEYRLRFSHLPKGLFFTLPGVGGDRTVDSDVYGGAVTGAITVNEDHPVEDGVAAGLTTVTPAAARTTAPLPPSAAQVGAVGVSPGPSGEHGAILASLGIGVLLLALGVGAGLRLPARSRSASARSRLPRGR